MSARNKTAKGRAAKALLVGRITRDEYLECLIGNMRVDGCTLSVWRGFKPGRWPLTKRPTARRYDFVRRLHT